MIRHRILWKLKESLSAEEAALVKQKAKRELEGLVGQIEGLVSLIVEIHGLPSSNADMLLDSLFVDAEALKNYSTSPIHNAVADAFVRPFTAQRLCLDYEEC